MKTKLVNTSRVFTNPILKLFVATYWCYCNKDPKGISGNKRSAVSLAKELTRTDSNLKRKLEFYTEYLIPDTIITNLK